MKNIFIAVTAFCLLAVATPAFSIVDHIMGEIAGEATTNSIILQSRLTAPEKDATGDVPGDNGIARFEIADNPDFYNSFFTDNIEADPEYDYVIKKKVTGLLPGKRYYYRLIFFEDSSDVKTGPTRTFKTNPAPEEIERVSIAVVTGMNYGRFHYGETLRPAYDGPDKHLGYPALASILRINPDYFVGTGDNVYYDQLPFATSTTGLRTKWHEQFVQQRYVDMFARIPTYWMKDDHDYRYDDCDNTDQMGRKPYPSPELGKWMFREQVPVTDPEDPLEETYRTRRMGKLLQVWFLEGRDYRTPNNRKDGPKKTIWGKEQRRWLLETLSESDAVFKIIISPTPMVGPDTARKNDNHTNQLGFKQEGETFFKWLAENGFHEKNLYLICGDRHWQYHAIHPSGFEEFSTGALVDANARAGNRPGQPDSTDPKGLIKQPFHPKEASGGFLILDVKPGEAGKPSTASFRFYEENGVLLYEEVKEAKGN